MPAGAGSAGTSSAYHLRKYAEADGIDLDIDLFERSAYIGGRSTTVNVLNDSVYPVELGASIFVKVNQILYNAAQEFGLPTDGSLSEDDPESDFAFGVWDGSQFVYKQPRGGLGWWDMTKLFWRYGLAPIRTQRLMNSTVSAFLEMYKKPLFPWTSLTQAAEKAGLLDSTSVTGYRLLEKKGISSIWAREIIQSSTRVNYGQNLATIHGLETMVCMATDDAMSIRGGNWRIFEGMAKASKAKILLNHTVTTLSKANTDDGRKKHSVCSTIIAHTDESTTETCSDYDIVILASPAQFSNIDFKDSLAYSTPDKIPYVSLHVTLLATPHRLSPDFFNISSSSVPSMIITTLNPTDHASKTRLDTGINGVGPSAFWSVNHLRTIAPDTYNNLTTSLHVYKIFSPSPINATFLSSLFSIPYDSPTPSFSDPLTSIPSSFLPWHYTKVWNSYPYLYPRVTFEELRLDADASSSSSSPEGSADVQGSIWYTAGMESFISTMETSALVGKNVAKLVVEGLLKGA